MVESVDTELKAEGRDALERYNAVTEIGKRHLASSALCQEKPFSDQDIEILRQFYLEATHHSHQKVMPSLWDHSLLASIYARKITERIIDTGSPVNLKPEEAECLGLLHDLSRIVVPHRYFRTDLVGNRLYQRIGIRKDLLEKTSTIEGILGRGRVINHPKDMTLPQIIINVADNIGKLNHKGELRNINEIIDYALSQPVRYNNNTLWAAEKWGLKALTTQGRQMSAITLLKSLIDELKVKYHVDFDQLRTDVVTEFNSERNQAWLQKLRNKAH